MSAQRKQKTLGEHEYSLAGCYGSVIKHSELSSWLKYNFWKNNQGYEKGLPRFSLCAWGHAGVGKTAAIKDFRNVEVEWRGRKYPGYDVHDVPIAQFEEMGDLHGLPVEHILMVSPASDNSGSSKTSKKTFNPSGSEETWINCKLVEQYRELGWGINATAGTRTLYAPPDWALFKPGPSILLLDDFNRSSIRVLKGIMQLLQNYEMMSWKLPEGNNIVLTGNPTEQDYLVTTIDKAHLTRIKHVTLQHDAVEWGLWAERNGIDSRGINFVLRYPEMMLGKERTNPRTLAEFFRILEDFPDVARAKDDITLHANSLLDDDTVSTMIVFMTRDMELVAEPEEILKGNKQAIERIQDLMDEKKQKQPRIDILSVTLERLFIRVCQPNCAITDSRKKNLHGFLEADFMPEEMRYGFCHRFMNVMKNEGAEGLGRAKLWIGGSEKLTKLILATLPT